MTASNGARRGVRLVFVGPPGAGKGTQAQLLADRFGAIQIATGDILRRHRREKTPLGAEAQSFMDAGKLVPDDLIIRMMEAEIAGHDSFILDGFPRTVPQAEALDALLERLHLPLVAVVMFETNRDELVVRLTGRLTNERTGRTYHVTFDPPKVAGIDDDDGGPLVTRPDDSIETVGKRLAEYDALTAAVVPYYEGLHMLVRVDAMQPVASVTAAIVAAIDARVAHAS